MGAMRSSFYILDKDNVVSGQLQADMWDDGWSAEKTAMPKKKIKVNLSNEQTPAGLVARTGTPLNVHDAYKDPRFFKDIDPTTGTVVRSCLVSPILDKNGVIVSGPVEGQIRVLNPQLQASKNKQEKQNYSAQPPAFSLHTHGVNNFCDKELTLIIRKQTAALMLSGLCHDVDHPGFNNNFLALCKHPLAQMYKSSILENHHFFLAKKIIEDKNILGKLPAMDRERILEELKYNILCTDLAVYFQIRAQLTPLVGDHTFDWTDSAHRKMVKGDKERLMGYTPLSMMDRRRSINQPAEQIQFLSVVVLPCVLLLQNVFPNTAPLTDNCRCTFIIKRRGDAPSASNQDSPTKRPSLYISINIISVMSYRIIILDFRSQTDLKVFNIEVPGWIPGRINVENELFYIVSDTP
ncbi:unnamed protein product [Diatraea saccharalis]|uniref:3',5'-cyclic-GMP phosphodiesterase n=1 Tax=Diatraea saccharalis TaxID=40085 RepID=A0A9N9R1D6_9NEOP|nr:unnamed protein product [Diatraea saccharalis]